MLLDVEAMVTKAVRKSEGVASSPTEEAFVRGPSQTLM